MTSEFEDSGFGDSDFEDSTPTEEQLKSWRHQWHQERRAKAVFDELMNGLPELPFSFDDEDMQKSQVAFDAHIERLNNLISNNLDSDSIWEFVFLAGNQRASYLAKESAVKRHAGARANKAKVFAWCDENISRFKSMDDAALDIAESFIPQKFRTVRDWMTEWRKLRSAS